MVPHLPLEPVVVSHLRGAGQGRVQGAESGGPRRSSEAPGRILTLIQKPKSVGIP